MEVVDLDQLLSEHHPSGGVADGVQGRGPGGEPDHVGDHHQHDAGHSGLCGQTNLVRSWVFLSQQVCISRDLESKLSRIVVHATAVHEAEHVLDSFVGKNPLPCDRTYASVGQGACHHGHALAVHLQAARLGGEIAFKSC